MQTGRVIARASILVMGLTLLSLLLGLGENLFLLTF